MVFCDKQEEALAAAVPGTAEWYTALIDLILCVREKVGIDQDEEERLLAVLKKQWEGLPLPDEVKPWPVPCDMRSKEVRGQIFADPKKAMVFSEGLAEAFEKTAIKLEDDETFACLVCVVPISRYMSEVIGPGFLEAGPTIATLTYIAGPKEMSIIFEAMSKSPI